MPDSGMRTSRQDAKDAKGTPREPDERLDRLAHAVIGAALEVHSSLGPGFLESVYEEALCVELQLRRIPFARQSPVPVFCKDHLVGEGRLDLLIGNSLIVELKAVETLAPVHTAQLISYLRATGCHLGLLLNFNALALRDGIRRVVAS
jgi:GxxExxY protein